MANKISKQVSEKVALQDECGDSLWDEVLNQQKELSVFGKVNKDKILLHQIALYAGKTPLTPGKYSVADLQIVCDSR